MLHNSTAIRPQSFQNGFWPGDEMSYINYTPVSGNGGGIHEEFYVVSPLTPESEGEMDFENYLLEAMGASLGTLSASNASNNGVGHTIVPQPPPLKARLTLPKRQFCTNGSQERVELTLVYDEDEERVLMTDLQGLLDFVKAITQTSGPHQDAKDNENRNISTHLILSQSPPFIPSSCSDSGTQQSLETNVFLPSSDHSPTNDSQTTLQNPVATPTDADTKPAPWQNTCHFCQKLFRTPYKLRRHLIVHTREKPYPCDKCGNTFTTKGHLTIHKRQHDHATESSTIQHPVKRDHLRLREFDCPMCDRTFTRKSDMKDHVSAAHLGIRHPCRQPNCGKIYSWERDLRKHQIDAHPITP